MTTSKAMAAARWISQAHMPAVLPRQPSADVHSRVSTGG